MSEEYQENRGEIEENILEELLNSTIDVFEDLAKEIGADFHMAGTSPPKSAEIKKVSKKDKSGSGSKKTDAQGRSPKKMMGVSGNNAISGNGIGKKSIETKSLEESAAQATGQSDLESLSQEEGDECFEIIDRNKLSEDKVNTAKVETGAEMDSREVERVMKLIQTGDTLVLHPGSIPTRNLPVRSTDKKIKQHNRARRLAGRSFKKNEQKEPYNSEDLQMESVSTLQLHDDTGKCTISSREEFVQDSNTGAVHCNGFSLRPGLRSLLSQV